MRTYGSADDGEHAVPSPFGDQQPGADRGNQYARHQRDELQSGGRRTRALDDLQIEGEIRYRTEQGKTDDEAERRCDRECAIGKQSQWQHRFGGAALNENERK